MKRVLLLTIIFLFAINRAIYAATPIDSTIAPMVQKVIPSIINIKAQIKITDLATLQEIIKQRRSKGVDLDEQVPATYNSVGSGVIVDAKNGYILTNAHVVNDAQIINITLSDGRHFNGKIIGLDKPSDVALIQIKAKNLTAIPLGDSSKLKVGDYVAAIGNPFGVLNGSVTSGIVSALGRSMLGIENYENFIQTDAPINPGNSGGALINMSGELVGINTAIIAPSQGNIGIGFAIPVNMTKSVMQQLIQFGDVKRGILGIGAQDITPELASAFNTTASKGAVITLVQAESPAAHAGLKIGDIITKINNFEIKNASDVVNTIGFMRVNSRTNIEVLRDNKTVQTTITLSDPKKRQFIVAQLDPFLFGVGMKNINQLSPIHGNVNGVQVVSIDEASNAWRSDLRAGDVIISANKHPVLTVADLKKEAAKASTTLLLNVIRGPSAMFLVISKEEVS